MQAIETIEYKGHSINVFYDECAENPFKNWDCEPDLLVFMSGHGYRYDEHEYSDSARREHLNQVKQWIKSKVPLIYRNGSELA